MCCWKYDDVAEVSAMSSGFLRPLVAQHVELPTQQVGTSCCNRCTSN